MLEKIAAVRAAIFSSREPAGEALLAEFETFAQRAERATLKFALGGRAEQLDCAAAGLRVDVELPRFVAAARAAGAAREACERAEARLVRAAFVPRSLRCVCGLDIPLVEASNDGHCPECGAVYMLNGLLATAPQLSSQDGLRAKSGQFVPGRHLEQWLRNLFAEESNEVLSRPGDVCGEKLVAQLREDARQKNMPLQLLTTNEMRQLLRDRRLTVLNSHVTLLLKLVTGVSPPPLSETTRQVLSRYFDLAIAARAELDAAAAEAAGVAVKASRGYYPSYIKRILEAILPPNAPERAIFKFIHVQGADTVRRGNAAWAQIAKKIGLPGAGDK